MPYSLCVGKNGAMVCKEENVFAGQDCAEKIAGLRQKVSIQGGVQLSRKGVGWVS